MTVKVKCPNCGEVRVITRKAAHSFYCCHNRWLISNHISFQTEKMPSSPSHKIIGKIIEKPRDEPLQVLEIVRNGTL